jgi:hypothetical protein
MDLWSRQLEANRQSHQHQRSEGQPYAFSDSDSLHPPPASSRAKLSEKDGRSRLIVDPCRLGEPALRRVHCLLLFLKLLREPCDGFSDLLDGLAAFGTFVEHGFNGPAVGRVELAKRVSR